MAGVSITYKRLVLAAAALSEQKKDRPLSHLRTFCVVKIIWSIGFNDLRHAVGAMAESDFAMLQE